MKRTDGRKKDVTGFLYNPIRRYHYLVYVKDNICIYFEEEHIIDIKISEKQVPLQKELLYVSDLQHLFFGLGINLELKIWI